MLGISKAYIMAQVKLKQEKLVLHKGEQHPRRAMAFTTIRDVLGRLPKSYPKELYEAKCDEV